MLSYKFLEQGYGHAYNFVGSIRVTYVSNRYKHTCWSRNYPERMGTEKWFKQVHMLNINWFTEDYYIHNYSNPQNKKELGTHANKYLTQRLNYHLTSNAN